MCASTCVHTHFSSVIKLPKLWTNCSQLQLLWDDVFFTTLCSCLHPPLPFTLPPLYPLGPLLTLSFCPHIPRTFSLPLFHFTFLMLSPNFQFHHALCLSIFLLGKTLQYVSTCAEYTKSYWSSFASLLTNIFNSNIFSMWLLVMLVGHLDIKWTCKCGVNEIRLMCKLWISL